LTFSKLITQKIIEYWGLGFTAEETVKALLDDGVKISLHAVYNHRKSLTAQNLIDELIRRQERAVLKADTDSPALAMKYRNELLKLLMPQRIEAAVSGLPKLLVEIVDNVKLKQDNVPVASETAASS
jgi:Fe2+ or Zn2+ uptake regulation protein